jgi:hypothetical protein
MSKMSGIGLTISVDNAAGAPVAIGPDVNSCTINTSRGEQDITGLDKSAVERLLLLGDAELGLTGTYNPALSHTVFADLAILAGQVGRTVTIVLPGAGLITLACEMVFPSYNLSRGADGSLTWTATGKLSSGTLPTFA